MNSIQNITIISTNGSTISWTAPEEDVQFGGLSTDEIRSLMTQLQHFAQYCLSPVVHDPDHAIAEVIADADDTMQDLGS